MAKVEILTRGQQLLKEKLSSMSQDTQAAYENGESQFIDSDYFKRVEITGKSSVMELLDNDDARKDGFTNISKQKINSGENLAIERIGIRVASVVADTFTAGTAKYLPVADITDGAVINAELELTIKQKKVFRGPISLFNEQIKAGSQAMWLTLDAPKLVTDQDEIQARVYFPNGAAVDATSSKKSFLELVLGGPTLNSTR